MFNLCQDVLKTAPGAGAAAKAQELVLGPDKTEGTLRTHTGVQQTTPVTSKQSVVPQITLEDMENDPSLYPEGSRYYMPNIKPKMTSQEHWEAKLEPS